MKKQLVTILLLTTAFGLFVCLKTDNERAQSALTDYFTYLSQGKYDQAAELYGGEYDVLADWNPEVDPDDHATLFEMGCLVNGLLCLPIGEIGAVEHGADGTYVFYVQFENPDGSLFVLDAVDAIGTESTFKYTVFLSEDEFLVKQLPLYLP